MLSLGVKGWNCRKLGFSVYYSSGLNQSMNLNCLGTPTDYTIAFILPPQSIYVQIPNRARHHRTRTVSANVPRAQLAGLACARRPSPLVPASHSARR